LTHAANEKDWELTRDPDKSVGSGKVRNSPGETITNAF